MATEREVPAPPSRDTIDAAGAAMWQVVAWRKDLYKVGQNMPLGGPQLSKTDQQNIYNWIQNGAKKD